MLPPRADALTVDSVRATLARVAYPGLTRDLVSFGMVRDVAVCGTQVRVELALRSARPDVVAELRRDIERLLADAGATAVTMEVVPPAFAPLRVTHPPADPWSDQVRLRDVRHVLAVGAGKGGVGKSTVAVNLALSLARAGLATGVLDADIYGPSLPLLLGLEDGARRARMTSGKHIVPLEAHGLPFVSFGFFLGEGSPVIWRGAMVSKAVKQFARGVAWPALDVLVVDLPPGTGDVPLSLAQAIELSGAIVVTQPPRVAMAEAAKAVAMFRALEVPVLGVVQNMTGAFGSASADATSHDLGVARLGSVAFDAAIVSDGDAGVPSVVARPSSESALAFDAIAHATLGALGWRWVEADA